MSTVIKKHPHQAEADKCTGETEMGELNWGNSEGNNTYMIPPECGKRRKESKLQKYFNSHEDRYIENKLTDAFS